MEENTVFRSATADDIANIWTVLQQAIELRRLDGSSQWQNGYPNVQTVEQDIKNGYAFVLTKNENIAGYVAMVPNYEPAYENIIGKWLREGEFLVIHRVAVGSDWRGKGIAKEIFRRAEEYATKNGMQSIKVDTNFDNAAMLAILDKLGYLYCGEVMLMGAPRRAFQKLL